MPEEEYRDGTPHGRVATWDEHGVPHLEGAFDRGHRHGHWTTWFPDGKRSEEGNYVADQPDGPWSYFHPGGQLKEKGVAARVVSMPSWELFEAQPPGYRESVLPAAVTVSGPVKVNWNGCVGPLSGVAWRIETPVFTSEIHCCAIAGIAKV